MNENGSANALVCRWCAAPDPVVVLDLGAQPPADHFPRPGDPPAPRRPLRMAVCAACGLAQLGEDPGVAEEPLGTEPRALVDQARDAVTRIADLVTAGATFTEFDSPHGGSWRELLTAAGAREDPAAPVDLVVDVFGLMHEPDQAAALRRRVDRLAPGGALLLQYHALSTIVRDGQWNALRHGHMAYYSTTALAGMLAALGLRATRAWEFGLYGGTVLLEARRVRRKDDSGERDRSDEQVVRDLLDRDAALGLGGADGVRPLALAAAEVCSQLRSWLTEQRRAGRLVLGYGAASRAVPLLVAAGIDASLLPAVADASPGKQGRLVASTGIPVISSRDLVARRPDGVLLFVPDLLDEVRAALPDVERNGGRWAVSEPAARYVVD